MKFERGWVDFVADLRRVVALSLPVMMARRWDRIFASEKSHALNFVQCAGRCDRHSAADINLGMPTFTPTEMLHAVLKCSILFPFSRHAATLSIVVRMPSLMRP